MRTVTQLHGLLSSYMAKGLTSATQFIAPLNLVLEEYYQLGNWKQLEVDYEVDASAGYVCLPPDYESILQARINDIPVDIQTMKYEYQRRGPGLLSAPVGSIYGLVDQGFVSLMSDLPEDGLEALTFTLGGGATWASGDVITVTYTTESNGRITTTSSSSPVYSR